MEKGVKKSIHDVASVLVKTKAPEVSRDRHESIVEGIDQKIKRLKQDRKEKAYSFINVFGKNDHSKANEAYRKIANHSLVMHRAVNSLVHSNVHTIGKELTQQERMDHADLFKFHKNEREKQLNLLKTLDKSSVEKSKNGKSSKYVAQHDWLDRGINRTIDSIPGMRKHMPK